MPGRQHELALRSQALSERGNILDSASVYLSGPMDFVADRAEEARSGWRARISKYLTAKGVTVYDPWNKPEVSGLPHYGKEDEFSARVRDGWTYADTTEARAKRDEICDYYWSTLHIDLRMTDLADFLIAYCPTNTYSVGTVHEIALARQQHKPVLLITPRFELTKASELRRHLEGDIAGLSLLDELEREAPVHANPQGVPSLWYMAMLESEDYFFDGFGFNQYDMQQMGWEPNEFLDTRETTFPPQRPLLPYLDSLDKAVPQRYDATAGKYVENADWLIFVDDDVRRKPSS